MSAPGTTADLDLSGHWRAGVADEELRRTWYSDDFDDDDFVDVTVPGHWRNDDAFGANDEPVLYRRRFSTLTPGPDTRAWLQLEGICTQGDIWLDGSYLGNTDGTWVPHQFEITRLATERNEHVLGIEVTSPASADRDAKRGLLGTWQDGPYVRPGWNPGGIWRPVRIHRTGPVAITGHRVLCTAANPSRAAVTVTCVIDSAVATEVTIRTTVDGADDERIQPLARGRNSVTWTIDIPDPRLWWPRELGEQPMSDVAVEIGVRADDDDDAVVRSDGFATKIGLRVVGMRDWTCTVNGESMFLRGVLVGPAAHALGTAETQVFADQIRTAHDLGCNVVRVHGHLSHDELYAEADRTGMLLWQDLPLYRTQSRSIRRVANRTAQAAVDRLGAHPSVVLWCAHDEPDLGTTTEAAAGFGRRLLSHELPNWNRSVLDRSVKRTLDEADGTRPVVASSGTWPHPPALTGSDTHLNLGWSEGQPDDLGRLARTIPRAVRFVQITPSPSTATATPADEEVLRRWPPENPTDLTEGSTVDSDVFEARLPPDAFDTYGQWARATRNYQARLIRSQIETLRRLKYRPTGGFTVAYLTDLRAAMSPALVGADGTPKPAYQAMRLACAPVLITLDPWPECTHPGDVIECVTHIVNDTRTALTDARLDIVLTAATADGDSRPTTWTFEGDVAADGVAAAGRIIFDVPDGIDRIDAALRLEATGVTSEAHYSVTVHVH